MATTNFTISKKANNGLCELKVRFSYDRQHSYRLRTYIMVPQAVWNASKGKVIIPRMHTREQKRLSQLQAQIDDLSSYLKAECLVAPVSVDKNYWDQKIQKFHKKDAQNSPPLLNHQASSPDKGEDVIDAFKEFINAKVPHEKTKAQMEVTMRDIERYMLYIKKELRLKEWTRSDLAGLKHFLEIEHSFFDQNGKCKRKYQYIYNASPLPMIPKARGGNTIFAIFVLQSNLGMRVGDFYGLTAANLVNDAIEYIPGKTLHDTGEVVRVPLTDRAKEIINRYSTNNSIGLMPFICEQKYNAAIKEMLRLAGINRIVTTLNPKTRLEEKHPIWEKASSHMARRNFIGNLYAKVQDPSLISSMTGHKPGSKAFERYRAIHDEIKKPILEIFN